MFGIEEILPEFSCDALRAGISQDA
jgi:hypothetical protein